MTNQVNHASTTIKESPASNGIDFDLISNTNGVSSKETAETTKELSATKEVRKVTIAEPANEDFNNESTRTITEPHDQADKEEFDDDGAAGNTPAEMGVGKKKRKKSKPKSKRGLVCITFDW